MLAFKQYLTEAEKQYKLRIKTIVPVDDAMMDRIERSIAKYMPIDMSRPKKTMLQRNPLDFANAINAEVWIIDVTVALPASPSVVREDVRKALNCAEEAVVVRNRYEASEIETMRQNAMADIEAEAERRNLIPAALLSDDPVYIEDVDQGENSLYGNKYNGALLSYLAKVEDDRPDMKVRSNNPMFTWLKPSKDDVTPPDTGDYNEVILDAPKPKPKAPSGVKLPDTQGLGGLEDSQTSISRVYTDKNGKKIVLSRKLDAE